MLLRGDNVMLGYWDDPDSTREVVRPEGLWTGDLARVDHDGYIYVLGRRSDMIKTGAYRISPQEIEELLLEIVGVADAAVVGWPDDILGQVVVAYVTLFAGHSGLNAETVLQRCNELLPRHKQVRRVEVVDSIPKTGSGKIKRHELRARADVRATQRVAGPAEKG